MDAMTPEFVTGVEQGVAAVKARIAALREEIRRLEASIGVGGDVAAVPQQPKRPAGPTAVTAGDPRLEQAIRERELAQRRARELGLSASNAAAGERMRSAPLPNIPSPIGPRPPAAEDIAGLRELLLKGTGVASAK